MLTEIGVDDQTPRIEVWNKLDLLPPEDRDAALARAAREGDVVAVSALDGQGIDALIAHLSTTLTAAHRRYDLTLAASDGAGAAWLHAHGEVLDSTADGMTTTYSVRLSDADYDRFNRREP